MVSYSLLPGLDSVCVCVLSWGPLCASSWLFPSRGTSASSAAATALIRGQGEEVREGWHAGERRGASVHVAAGSGRMSSVIYSSLITCKFTGKLIVETLHRFIFQNSHTNHQHLYQELGIFTALEFSHQRDAT